MQPCGHVVEFGFMDEHVRKTVVKPPCALSATNGVNCSVVDCSKMVQYCPRYGAEIKLLLWNLGESKARKRTGRRLRLLSTGAISLRLIQSLMSHCGEVIDLDRVFTNVKAGNREIVGINPRLLLGVVCIWSKCQELSNAYTTEHESDDTTHNAIPFDSF